MYSPLSPYHSAFQYSFHVITLHSCPTCAFRSQYVIQNSETRENKTVLRSQAILCNVIVLNYANFPEDGIIPSSFIAVERDNIIRKLAIKEEFRNEKS